MPGSGNPTVGSANILIGAALIIFILMLAYSAVAPLFGWPQIE